MSYVMVSHSLEQGQINPVQPSLLLYILRYHLKFRSSEFLHYNNFSLVHLLLPIY